MNRNWPPKLPQTGYPKQKSPERRPHPPTFVQKLVIKDTRATAASSRPPTGLPGYQVPKKYIRARGGVHRIPRKQAGPAASKPRHPVTKRDIPRYSPER